MEEKEKICIECQKEKGDNALPALWGSDYCWGHLKKQGGEAVNNWIKKGIENKNHLEGANLWRATLKKVRLDHANLKGANLERAECLKTNLWAANLEGANLRRVNFKNASLWDANLKGANLTLVDLKDAEIVRIKYTEFVRLPESIKNLLKKLLNWLRFEPKNKDKLPKLLAKIIAYKENLLERLEKPTLWNSANVEEVGRCDPLVLKYIKDQSWLEAKLDKSRKSLWSRFWMFLWGITCGYGSNIGLWILWCGVIILGFAGIYAFFWNNLFEDGYMTCWHKFWNALYGSFVTFIPMTLENLKPIGLAGRLLMLLEGIFGYVMLAGLISIFANRLARLS